MGLRLCMGVCDRVWDRDRAGFGAGAEDGGDRSRSGVVLGVGLRLGVG